MQQSTSLVIVYRSYTRDSTINLICSNILHHAFTLSSNCLEPSTLAVSRSSSSDRNGMDSSGRSVSATVAFSVTHLSRKFAGRSPHVVVRRGASANAAAAGNLATTGVTLMTTRNKFMRVHLPVYMINSCNHVSCQHLNHNIIIM